MPLRRPSHYEFAEIIRFVGEHSGHGLALAPTVAKLVRMILGEDGVEDDQGLSIKELRWHLRCWVDKRTSSVAAVDLPKVLRELCLLNFDAGQVAELERAAKSVVRQHVGWSPLVPSPTTTHASQALVTLYEGDAGGIVMRAPPSTSMG